MVRDLRFAVRLLLRSPGFTAVAVLTLALGIAANTSIFSAVDAVLLHPLRYPHPEQLVDITKTMPMFGLFQSVSSALDFQDYRARSRAFSGMSAIGRAQFNLTSNRQPERVPGMRVSADYLEVLGVRPILGRSFAREEEQWGRHHVAILTEPFWRTHFASDRQIIGKQMELDGEPYTVIGIAPPLLTFFSRCDLLTPLAFAPAELAPNRRGHQNLDVIGRLKPGVTLAQAGDDFGRVGAELTRQMPNWYPKGWSLEGRPLAARLVGPLRTPLLVLVGAVALVLLIGCANVANLLLARAASRQKEITIRTALGARRTLIVRQLLTESALIAVVAGLVGLGASVWLLDLCTRFGAQGLLRGQKLEINNVVGGFTLLISLAATILFGLAPAIATSRADLNESLKETARGASLSAGKQRLRSVLVACEVGLSLTLLISAGLLIRSFIRLQQSSPGFDAAGLAVFQTSLPPLEYQQPPRIVAFYDQLLTRLASLPGVASAGAVSFLPFTGSSSGGSFNIVGRQWPTGSTPDVSYRMATPGYFEAMRIPLLQGRVFTGQDGFTAPKVAVVDQPFVQQFFAKENPIGQQLSGPRGETYTIVGVVGGVKNSSMSETPAAIIYYPAFQAPSAAMAFVVRTAAGNPESVMPSVTALVRELDRNLPVYRASTMEQLLADSLARTRWSTTLLAIFAAMALLLAAIGIYGVISYSVSQRGHEIGIRMALGAQPREAVWLVLRQAAVPILAGIAGGLSASWTAARALSTLLYGVSASDPLIFTGLPLFLAAVALAASYVPARRATRVDPMSALRYE